MGELTLEQQVTRLTAIEDIKQLKAQYCAYCDDGYDPEGIARLFTEDAIWDGADFGRHVGIEAITEFFAGISADITFAGHLVLNPIITVNGDKANGKWWLIMPCTTNTDGTKEAKWLAAEYDDDYIKKDGKWFFKHLKLDVKFFAPHLSGWVGQT